MKTFLLSYQPKLIKFALCGIILLISVVNVSTAATSNWTGALSSDWSNSGNWDSGGVPGTSSIVQIGVTVGFNNQPVINSSTGTTISSLIFGVNGLIVLGTTTTVTTLTVNSGFTLAVSGSITQNSSTVVISALSSNTFTTTIAGAGTITCSSLTVGNSTAFLVVSLLSTNLVKVVSTIANLSISGGLVVNSTTQGTTVIPLVVAIGFNNATFSLQGGTTSVGTTIKTVNTTQGLILTGNSVPNISIDMPTGSSLTPVLQLAGAHAIDATSVANSIDFYNNTGGTGTCTVNYNGASQEVYTTSLSTILNTSPQVYQYLSLTGTGAKTPDGSLLTVGADLTSLTPTIVAFNTNNPTVTVGGNWINSSTANQGSGNITVTGSVTNNSSGTLSLGSANLSIATNYTNNLGGVYTQSTGTTIFNGSSAQSLTDNSTTGTTFNLVNFTSGGTKTMSGTGSFAVSSTGILTMAASTVLQTGNILTLNSASTSTATVAAIPSSASITGTVNAQRYISGGSNAYRGYRFLSSPVYTATTGSGSSANYYYSLGYLPTYVPLTSTSGTLGGFTKAGNPSVYLYRDNVVFTNSSFNTGNFRSINAINYTPSYFIGVDFDGGFNLHVGTGIMLFYRGDNSNLSTKWITTTSAESNVFVSTGTLNQQAVNVVNWYTQTTTLQHDVVSGNPSNYTGFNLVGNPYASSIDWNTYSTTNNAAGIYAPNVGNSIYIYNEVSKVYAVYNGTTGTNGGSRTIPSGQGFFVKTTAAGATMTFNEAAKVNTQVAGPTQPTGPTLLLSKRMTNDDLNTNSLQDIRLEMAADSINKEETVICFKSDAQNGFVVNEDSQYLTGSGKVGLCSMSADSVPLAINNIPLPKPNQTIVRLEIGATTDGVYTLNRTEINNIPKLYRVWLMDAYMKDSLDIRNNATYTFNLYKADGNSYGANRFSVVIRQDPAMMVHLLSFTATKAKDGALVAWTTENEDSYTNFTVERSTDGGSTFNALGSLLSNGTGNYSFLDKTPLLTSDKYRVQVTDLNGGITYSPVMTLNYDVSNNAQASNNIMIYPNPVSSVMHLAINQNNGSSNISSLQLADLNSNINKTTNPTTYDIKIISLAGYVVKTETSSQPTWQDNVSALSPGTYVIRVVNNNDKSLVGKSTFIKLGN
ncbi:putative secreted protein (Por secretion system target) [Mucilaginibacter frigoritolerans]|uniref:Putative secreted protein (Por secretion system target) n=1 Tax=Mucilaginibacter frigoritolerans TaxID=652788 RepID=A0A562U2L9_9SPHI|nr:T9SS type A sorting domain-containing protein [Mucilaginibacter frigoritolerans]TWJ00096.1 putative secreted protein (Por secretion system target) [Mucilaginibacter frigoritolerans]